MLAVLGADGAPRRHACILAGGAPTSGRGSCCRSRSCPRAARQRRSSKARSTRLGESARPTSSWTIVASRATATQEHSTPARHDHDASPAPRSCASHLPAGAAAPVERAYVHDARGLEGATDRQRCAGPRDPAAAVRRSPACCASPRGPCVTRVEARFERSGSRDAALRRRAAGSPVLPLSRPAAKIQDMPSLGDERRARLRDARLYLVCGAAGDGRDLAGVPRRGAARWRGRGPAAREGRATTRRSCGRHRRSARRATRMARCSC